MTATARAEARPYDDESVRWAPPDLMILANNRLPAPELPVDVFGPWEPWINDTAEGKAAPKDYVAGALLTVGGSLIGNARRVSPWGSWTEPAVIWCAEIGAPSYNKSPALDPLRSIISRLEDERAQGYEITLRRWRTDVEAAKNHRADWEKRVAQATKSRGDVPLMPECAVEPEKPARPRLLVTNATPEALCAVHAGQPKGLIQYRDELSSWIGDMDRYAGNGGERALYLEAYGARPYIIDRVKLDQPIRIPHFSVCVLGGIQPDKLQNCIMAGDDDGLSARFLYIWPDKVAVRRPRQVADDGFALVALQRLMFLPMLPKEPDGLQPVIVPLETSAQADFETWWRDILEAADKASGKLASHMGKMPGICLRLALVLEYLWWSAEDRSEPMGVSLKAIIAAMALVDDYFLPMAQRAFGDAALPQERRLATALARHIVTEKITRLNARELYRSGRVAGIVDAATAQLAVDYLVESNWLRLAGEREGGGTGRARKDYEVNPMVHEAAHG